MDEELDGLINNIRLSFADVTQPNDENIIAGDSAHFATCDECRTARKYFAGRTRESLFQDAGALQQTIYAFSLFTPPAWHYYLPVYLIGCLQSQHLRIDDFWHHDEPIVRTRLWPARIRQLTGQQCAVLINYLQYLLSKTDPQIDVFARCRRVLDW